MEQASMLTCVRLRKENQVNCSEKLPRFRVQSISRHPELKKVDLNLSPLAEEVGIIDGASLLSSFLQIFDMLVLRKAAWLGPLRSWTELKDSRTPNF